MIRSAKENDIPAICSLIRSGHGWLDEWADDVVSRALCSSNGLSYVWADISILGFISAHDVGFRGYISDIVVLQAARKRGIGRSLVNQVERELARRGCHIVISDIWHEAEFFYRELDWEPVTSSVKLFKKKLNFT